VLCVSVRQFIPEDLAEILPGLELAPELKPEPDPSLDIPPF
jgi:hypothetical protein